MITKRKNMMPDKITVINLVWSAVIASMLTATVTLYQDGSDNRQASYPQITGRYQNVSYY